MDTYKLLCNYLKQIRDITDFVPVTALVLGSGLGDSVNLSNIQCVIDYSDILGFPVSTNKMHKGRFIFGYINNKPVVVMQGRIHYYEGYTMEQVVMPIRLMRMMGAKNLILTNAAGGINNSFKPGDFMIITDHISSFVPSPLIGPNIDELGIRFPDMTNVYDKNLTDIIRKSAAELNIDLHEGVYLQVSGPNYETPAEINAYRILGADAVGMSTVCEAIAAVQCGFKVCGISCITNMTAGITEEPLDDKEVGEIASHCSNIFGKLISKVIHSL